MEGLIGLRKLEVETDGGALCFKVNNRAICEAASPTITSIQLDHERIGFMAAKMAVTARSGKTGGRRRIPLLVSPLLAVRRKSTGGSGRREPHILAAIEAIRSKACDGLSASDVIAASPGSKSLFNLRFREVTGHSVHDEIENVRMETVFTLLAETGTAIGAIAGLCGYSTHIALHKAFRIRTRTSMAAWRAANRL